MKKLIAISIFFMILMLAGCDSRADNSASTVMGDNQEPTQGADHGTNGTSSAINEISLLTDIRGGVSKTSTYSKDGYYEIIRPNENGFNILYTDYATMTRIYLCNRPDCTHNDDTCTSWLKGSVGGMLFMNQGGDRLFYLYYGIAADDYPSEDTLGRLFTMQPNGSDKQEIYTLRADEEFIDAVVADEQYLYITVLVIDPETYAMKKELRAIDMQNGNSSLVKVLDIDTERVFGAFDNYILIEKTDASVQVFYGIDPASQTENEFYAFNYVDRFMLTEPCGSRLLLIEPTSDIAARVSAIDFHTGDESVLAENIPLFDSAATFVFGHYDDRAILRVIDNRDVEQGIHTYQYAIDLSQGGVTELKLTYDFYDAIRHVNILAANESHFLVENGFQHGTVTLTDDVGVPYTVDTDIPAHALILKTDYWSNSANYLDITDTVSD